METADAQYATQRLRDLKVGVTQPRLLILDYLDKHRTHPTVDTIYHDLHEHYPSLSRTTVYNNVQTLARCGAIQMLSIDQTHINVDGDTSPHAHLLCRQCGRIVDMPLQGQLDNNGEGMMVVNGHHITEVHQYYRGICSECSKEQ